MSAHNQPARTSSFTRRAMIKSFAGAVVGGTLISTGFVVSASSPRANRETGTAPVLNGLSGFTSDTTTTIVRRRYERRTAD